VEVGAGLAIVVAVEVEVDVVVSRFSWRLEVTTVMRAKRRIEGFILTVISGWLFVIEVAYMRLYCIRVKS